MQLGPPCPELHIANEALRQSSTVAQEEGFKSWLSRVLVLHDHGERSLEPTQFHIHSPFGFPRQLSGQVEGLPTPGKRSDLLKVTNEKQQPSLNCNLALLTPSPRLMLVYSMHKEISHGEPLINTCPSGVFIAFS